MPSEKAGQYTVTLSGEEVHTILATKNKLIANLTDEIKIKDGLIRNQELEIKDLQNGCSAHLNTITMLRTKLREKEEATEVVDSLFRLFARRLREIRPADEHEYD